MLARGLTKSFGAVTAVRGLDLTVHTGEIFGFLGPNGAGKSTTMAMLCTLCRPTSGRAWVAGHDVAAEPRAVRRRIGMVFQEHTLDLDLTARENLRLHAELYGMHRHESGALAPVMLELVGLDDRADTLVRTFSGGMKRRLEMARALAHSPAVLFLDEPTAGLDPQTRAHIWEHLRSLPGQRGTTLFVTTHYLDEAEHCDRIAITDHGRVVAVGSPAELKSVLGADLVRVRTGDDTAAAAAVRACFDLPVTVGHDGVAIRVSDGAAFVPRLCAALPVPIHSVAVTRPSLDEVFLHLTGQAIRDDALPCPAGQR